MEVLGQLKLHNAASQTGLRLDLCIVLQKRRPKIRKHSFMGRKRCNFAIHHSR